MAQFETNYLAEGIYQVFAVGSFKEEDTETLSSLLYEIYEPESASYVIINLSKNYVLPLQSLGARILRFYREITNNAPMYIAIIVQPSLAQVLGCVLKTLMRREWVQTFTDTKLAQQWLALEQKKQGV
jgi:hypothetical protein